MYPKLFLLTLSMMLLSVSLKTNSPLKTVMFLILALIMMSPALCLISHVWFVYLMLMLFLGGIFVLVLYFSSLSTYMYKEVKVLLFFSFSMLFSPWLVYFISGLASIASLFNYSFFGFVIMLILIMVSLMLFSSYMLSSGSALRSM